MNISNYDDLVRAAAAQSQAQRLLFTFVKTELPGDANAHEQARFAARRGGTLTPVMCVDKLPGELGSFADLVDESRKTGAHWDLVFVTSMSGRDGQAPSSQQADAPLKMMVAAIEGGQIGQFLAFDRAGDPLRFD